MPLHLDAQVTDSNGARHSLCAVYGGKNGKLRLPPSAAFLSASLAPAYPSSWNGAVLRPLQGIYDTRMK